MRLGRIDQKVIRVQISSLVPKMNKDNIIKKIEIEIAGVNINVTPTQARALLDALSELLNIQLGVKIVEVERWRHNPIPYQPFWYYANTLIKSKSLEDDGKWQINYTTSNNTASLKI